MSKGLRILEPELQKTAKDSRGRDKARITESDFVTEPTETMLLIKRIKNNENLSWRELADEYFPQYSHAYVRKVGLGYSQCDEIDYILGTKERPPKTVPVPPCPDCGQVHERKSTCTEQLERQRAQKRHRRAADFGTGPDARALSERWDALAEQWGGLTGLCRGLLEGKYKVTETER